MREWKSADGKKTVMAEMVACESNTVSLLLQNGKQLTTSLDNFSLKDRSYAIVITKYGGDTNKISQGSFFYTEALLKSVDKAIGQLQTARLSQQKATQTLKDFDNMVHKYGCATSTLVDALCRYPNCTQYRAANQDAAEELRDKIDQELKNVLATGKFDRFRNADPKTEEKAIEVGKMWAKKLVEDKEVISAEYVDDTQYSPSFPYKGAYDFDGFAYVRFDFTFITRAGLHRTNRGCLLIGYERTRLKWLYDPIGSSIDGVPLFPSH